MCICMMKFATVLNKFRFHTIGMTFDISKMFREVVFDEVDRDLHCFLQIDLTTNQLKDYRMTHVTFGVVCSPF